MTDTTDKVRVTHIANAGLLLELGGRKMIIDALFNDAEHPFGVIPPDTLGNLMHGQPPFDGVEHILFTHCHPDHFSAAMTLEHLKNNAVKTVILPKAGTDGELGEFLQDSGITCIPLSACCGETVLRLSPDISVRVLPTKHLDRKFANVEHFCFLIQFAERRLLFTGDVDYVNETLSFLPETGLDAVFVNPLFFSALCRRRFFKGDLNSAVFCVHHLPFAHDDALQANTSLERELQRWERDRGRVIVLNAKNRSFDI